MEGRGDGAIAADRGRLLLGLVLLGLGLRLARFLLNYPLWCDETMLAANLLDREWDDLARPLLYRQVAPLGFLALEWLAVRGLGFSEWALRLVPALAALATVPLFALLARRVLGARSDAALIAVALFAVAQPPIRYGAEVKPYAVDLLAAVILLLLAIRWREAPGRTGRLWALAAAVPCAIAVSLPSVFVAGAVVAVVAVDVLRRRATGALPATIGVLVALSGALAAMAWLGQYRTTPDDRAYFLKFWAEAFPPAGGGPAALLGWLAKVHTGALVAYPHGEIRPLAWLNVAMLAAFVAGTVVTWRRDRGAVALLVLPFGLALAAAILRRYPYGASPRVVQFLVPSTLILAGAGIDRALVHVPALGRLGVARRRDLALAGVIGGLVAFGGWRLATDLGRPYRTPWDRTGREFARWFWEELGADAELVCVQADLGIAPGPKAWAYDGNDQYLCYQRIYSKRHRDGRPPRWEAISPTHPLRCVLVGKGPDDLPAFRDWLDARRDRFTLRDVRSYPATRGSTVEPKLTYVVCELVPATPATVIATRPVEPGR